MCFIATIIKIKEDKNLIYPISKMLLEEQNSNDDGSGAYCFNEKDDVIYDKRKLKEDAKSICQNILKFDIVNYHFRNSTIGSVKEDNVHFWKIGDWIFAHNGTVSDLKEGDKADSLVFFEKLIQKGFLRKNGNINFNKIKIFTNSTSLWGRFIIINSVDKKMYFFGDFKVSLLNRSSLIITSSKADFENVIDVRGINFEISDGLEVLEAEIDGVNMYSFKSGFKNLLEKFVEYGYRTYANYGINDTPEEKTKEKIVKSEIDMENSYLTTDEYQNEIEKIELQFEMASKKLMDSEKTTEDIKEYERSEIKYNCDYDFADELFFGSKQTRKLVLVD